MSTGMPAGSITRGADLVAIARYALAWTIGATLAVAGIAGLLRLTDSSPPRRTPAVCIAPPGEFAAIGTSASRMLGCKWSSPTPAGGG
jgi:hypothetical protein